MSTVVNPDDAASVLALEVLNSAAIFSHNECVAESEKMTGSVIASRCWGEALGVVEVLENGESLVVK